MVGMLSDSRFGEGKMMTTELRLGPPVAYSPVAFQAGGLYHPGFWLGVVEGVQLPIRIDVSGVPVVGVIEELAAAQAAKETI